MGIFAVMLLVGLTNANITCPENSNLVDYRCNIKCSEIGLRKCLRPAGPGCKCTFKENYFDEAGECVNIARCQKGYVYCPGNTSYLQDGLCSVTCQDMYRFNHCLQPIEPLCKCSPNHFITNAGNCVEAINCPREDIKCQPGLVLKCGNGVLATCDNYKSVNETRSDECIPTCVCPKTGHVYDKKSKHCFPKGDCDLLNSRRNCVKIPCGKKECPEGVCLDTCNWICECKAGYEFDQDTKVCEEII